MYKILILLLVVLPCKSFATASAIEIIVDVNGNPISNLDVDKRIKLMTSLLGNYQNEQVVEELINEIIITNEAERLKIRLTDKELNNAVKLFFTQGFGLKNEEVDRYIKEHNIDLNALTRKVRCDLLLQKIIEAMQLISKVSNEEVENAKKQINKPDYLISLQEMMIPEQKMITFKQQMYDLAKRWRDFVPNSTMKIREMTVSLNKSTDRLKNVLEILEIGSITDPIYINKGYYSIIKVIDKVKIDYELLNSTLSLKQAVVKDSIMDLKKVNCVNFDAMVQPAEVKEFKIRMRDLNTHLQVAFSKGKINEITKIQDGTAVKLVMLCNIENNIITTEELKSRIYIQKLIAQSGILLDGMRKNAVIHYHKKSIGI